jgi:hypothetical protein
LGVIGELFGGRIEVIEPLALLPYPRTACRIAVPPCYRRCRGCRPLLAPP